MATYASKLQRRSAHLPFAKKTVDKLAEMDQWAKPLRPYVFYMLFGSYTHWIKDS
jgi:hypothetical protein